MSSTSRAFFGALQTELAFYVGCLNLHERLLELRAPFTFPEASELGAPRFSSKELYDLSLALSMNKRPVGNDVAADGKSLVIVTGANQGGKTTFLRSVGRRRRDYDHRVRVRRELSLSWSARRDGESEARGRAKDLWYHHRLPTGGRVAGPSPSRPFNRRNARLSMGGRETGERRVVSRAPSSPGGRGSRASVRSATPSATPAPPRSSARQCPRGRSRAGRRRH